MRYTHSRRQKQTHLRGRHSWLKQWLMHLTRMTIPALLVLLLLFSWLGWRASAQAAAQQPTPTAHTHVHATAPLGMPAITPHSGAGTSSSSGPTYSSSDAVAYVTSHGIFHALSLTKVTVVKVQFVTSKQASDLLQGEYIGLPDNALVCYVVVSGKFVFPSSTTDDTYYLAVEVFDAHNGNLILNGGLL